MGRLIEIEKLSKSFGEQKVLDKIDFNLESGEIVGLIGPSGSGKSTLIKTMLGMEKADEGEALILDYKMPKREILSNIGYMAQSDALYEMLTGYELFKQRDNGVGILVTTHVMDEAELTDKVGLLLNGDIIDFDTPQQLKVKNNVKTIEEVFLKVEEN